MKNSNSAAGARPRLLFFCQHLLGLGHLTRSLATCQELISYFEVDFIQGGPDVGKTISHPHFHHTFLSPFLMRESDSSLYDPSGKLSVEELTQLRSSQIAALLEKNQYDFVVTELFPFGRKKFKREILQMIDRVKKKNPRAQVYCGLRDILVTKPDAAKRDREMAALVNEYYDGVLVHSDERILLIDETFSQVPLIADKMHYTGFITETHPPECHEPRRSEVLVSMGGGIVGAEMLLAVAEASILLPELSFRFLTGPYAPADLQQKLEAIRDKHHTRIVVQGFSKNFEADLQTVALSISLAGYNTIMNTLNTKTMALVYPYLANEEQTLRGRKFEVTKAVKLFFPEELVPEKMATIIRENIFKFPKDIEIDLDGAANTARFLIKKWEELT